MSPAPLVLVTGSAGRVGQAVVKELLARGRAVRGFDCVATPGLPSAVVGNLTDETAVREAVAGVDTLIHLAATPDDDDFLTRLLPNNIVGLYHVMEAARLAGVRRLILASTGQVNWWQRARVSRPIRWDEPTTPRAWYAAGKVFMEGIGQGYSEAHGMSVIAARLGWCPRTVAQLEEIAALDWARDVYLSPGDAGRFFAAAVEAPESVRFAIVYATSKPWQQLRFDLDHTRELLGWEPQETWPDGLEIITGKKLSPGE